MPPTGYKKATHKKGPIQFLYGKKAFPPLCRMNCSRFDKRQGGDWLVEDDTSKVSCINCLRIINGTTKRRD